MIALKPALQRFDWGASQGIPQLLGFEPDGGPYAEAWWGAHPLAPSATETGDLKALIDDDLIGALGADVAQAFGRLPFLLKVLSIAKPLSIQVHPTSSRAHRGFTADEAKGLDIHDPARTFKDTSHKPEMLLALTELTVLSGFRPVEDLASDLHAIGGPDAKDLARIATVAGMGAYVAAALHGSHAGALDALARAGAESTASVRIAAHALTEHQGDPGALVALAMNAVTLKPGEAIFTDAGIVHCYVSGLGVEIMANSDNVVRAGLTSKPIDIDLLVDLALLEPTAPALIASSSTADGVRIFNTSAQEFSLAVIQGKVATVSGGPRIVLAVSGEASVTVDGQSRLLAQGEAVFIAASEGAATIKAEAMTVVASVRGARD